MMVLLKGATIRFLSPLHLIVNKNSNNLDSGCQTASYIENNCYYIFCLHKEYICTKLMILNIFKIYEKIGNYKKIIYFVKSINSNIIIKIFVIYLYKVYLTKNNVLKMVVELIN